MKKEHQAGMLQKELNASHAKLSEAKTVRAKTMQNINNKKAPLPQKIRPVR